MKTRIALLRGINVVGRNKLPMKDLRSVLEGLDAESVRTYIQSGNVVFRHRRGDTEGLATEMESAIGKAFGFRPRVLVMGPERLERAILRNPFPEAETEPKSLHVFFLATAPGGSCREKLDRLKVASERYALDGVNFYLHTPEGFAQSKLAKGAERALGVPATARNWRTVGKLREMAREIG